MGLNADERKLLEELQERAAQPDEDDDFEIEVYDTGAGKGARIPYRKGKGWLHEVFGIGEPPEAAAADGADDGDGGTGGDAPPAGPARKAKAAGGGYFGRQ